MIQQLVARAQEWMQGIQATYEVNPLVFGILLIACSPLFYYSIYRLVRALARKDSRRITIWSSLFLLSAGLPYFYVLLFGRNMPWWIYIVIGLLIAQGVYSLVRKLVTGGRTREPEA